MNRPQGAARAEQIMRHLGASLLAGGALVAGPFAVFALSYKTYNLVKLGHWYAWGAPTSIGMFNRIVSILLIATLVAGVTLLGTAAVLRRRLRRKAATAQQPVNGPLQTPEHPERTLLPMS